MTVDEAIAYALVIRDAEDERDLALVTLAAEVRRLRAGVEAVRALPRHNTEGPMTNPHWYIDAHDRFISDVTPLVTLSVEGDATGYEWAVNAHGDGRGAGDWSTMASGEAPGIESAKLAAVEAWRRWAREQAIAAGFVVTDPVEPEVGGEG